MRGRMQSVMARVRDRLALAGLKLCVPRGRPRVRYGEVPFAKGGPLTKLRLLAPAFPAHRVRFNILYLLSAGRVDMDFVRAAKAGGARVVLNQNGVYFPAVRPRDWAAANEPMREMIGAADVVLYQSAFSRSGADRFLGEAPARWEILHNAVDTERFTPRGSAVRPNPFLLFSTGLVKDGPAFGFLDSLLDALRSLKACRVDWRFRFAGEFDRMDAPGSYRPQVMERIRQYGLESFAELHEPLGRAELPALFRQADLYLHNKSNDWCPNAVLEAMASGLPVVYSASGGTPELVGAEAGVGVPVEMDWQALRFPDPKTYAAAICRAMDEREAMSKAARRLAVERFDIRRWVGRHRTIFEELISAKGAP